MTDTLPLPMRLSQTLGITTSLLLAGQTITLSTFVIPRILESPVPLLLRQWSNTYHNGSRAGPPLALLSATSYFYLATKYSISSTALGLSAFNPKSTAYALAGVFALSIVPYTVAFIRPTNGELFRRAKEFEGVKGAGEGYVEARGKGDGEERKSAHELVDWWGLLNLGRGALLVVSGVLGVWTALN